MTFVSIGHNYRLIHGKFANCVRIITTRRIDEKCGYLSRLMPWLLTTPHAKSALRVCEAKDCDARIPQMIPYFRLDAGVGPVFVVLLS